MRSDVAKKGVPAAPNRALFYALGYTKEELERLTEAIYSFAQNRMCQIVPLTFQQMDGLNTVLPYGIIRVYATRTLTTESLAIFIPFKVQEILEKGGAYAAQRNHLDRRN